MSQSDIVIRGAREHNLRNVDLTLPRNQLICMTGVSGSGKSSLAFDTLYAEGQRRYVESLSSYARQFLGQMPKPEVDSITGLAPSISIQQKSSGRNPRSTVGTVTELYDYLRVLYARVGRGCCAVCTREISAQSHEQIVGSILTLSEGTRFQLLAPVVQQQKGEYRDLFEDLLKQGYLRARVDGTVVSLTEDLKLDRHMRHNIEVVIDRMTAGKNIRGRLTEAVENALRLGDGKLIVTVEGMEGDVAPDVENTARAGSSNEDAPETADPNRAHSAFTDRVYSSRYACTHCGISYEPPEPQLFSFNSPLGMCLDCNGLGMRHGFVIERMVSNPNLSIQKGAIALIGPFKDLGRWRKHLFVGAAAAIERKLGLPEGSLLKTPWEKLDEQARHLFLHGLGQQNVTFSWRHSGGVWKHGGLYNGILAELLESYRTAKNPMRRRQLEKYMEFAPCATCGGGRLNPQARHVYLKTTSEAALRRGTPAELSISQVCALSIQEAAEFFESLELDSTGQLIADEVLKEIRGRLGFLLRCGLDYLSLDRTAPTLSGGESQRIRLAGQIGCGLVGVVYILDEPSIGLHPRDNSLLLGSLCDLRDQGNTVIVVEHDEETMRAADHLVDFGPGPGVRGGEVVVAGTLNDLRNEPRSLTGQYLSGAKVIATPKTRRQPSDRWLRLFGARHNNLKNIDVSIPLGLFVCVTGVSGSGKSSLTNDILWHILNRELNGAGPRDDAASTSDDLENDKPEKGSRKKSVKTSSRNSDIETEISSLRGNKESSAQQVKDGPGKRRKGAGKDAEEESNGAPGEEDGSSLRSMGRLVQGRYDRIEGLEHLDKAIDIDQSPIGRTPRSNPATYVKLFDQIRELFTNLPESKIRGYKPGRFSFNVSGGRCEACEGYGSNKLEMDFLADVWVTCPVCGGGRFNHETLEVRFKGASIADVLGMDIEQAQKHFENQPKIVRLLDALHGVGLDYLKLGQASPTLSGGEAQRIKLARELGKRSTGRTLYLLDEPTTGLHFSDIDKLLEVLHGLVDAGNTVLVVEHNQDVIKTADWVIDLGPEGGAGGGEVVVAGTPETVAASPHSYTGRALAVHMGLPPAGLLGTASPTADLATNHVLSSSKRKKSNRPRGRKNNLDEAAKTAEVQTAAISSTGVDRESGRWASLSRNSTNAPARLPGHTGAGANGNGDHLKNAATQRVPYSTEITVRGASQHNLQNVSINIPRDKMSVFCGPSGSGKTSLAMETLYAEGQRRYVESLSAYARQFLGQMPKPRVEHIHGLSPAIAIEQKSTGHTPRSTVGTVTEIYDYLRILFARLGKPYCPDCQIPVETQTADEVVEKLMSLAAGTKLLLLAPQDVPVGQSYEKLWEKLKGDGFARVRVDGVTYSLDKPAKFDRRRKHLVEIVVDRVTVSDKGRSRLAGSVESALDLGRGWLHVAHVDESRSEEEWQIDRFSLHFACQKCGRSFDELTPHRFSFNGPLGWCPACQGLGTEQGADIVDQLIDFRKSVLDGAILGIGEISRHPHLHAMLETIGKELRIPLDVPLNQLSESIVRPLMFGTGERWFEADWALSPTEHDDATKSSEAEATSSTSVEKSSSTSTTSNLTASEKNGDQGESQSPLAKATSKSRKSASKKGALGTTTRRKKANGKDATNGEESTNSEMRRSTGSADNRVQNGMVSRRFRFQYKGFFPAIEEATRVSFVMRQQLAGTVGEVRCTACQGSRLYDVPSAVRFHGKTIQQICDLPLGEALAFLKNVKLSTREKKIAGDLLAEATGRLSFLVDVGLHYLSLGRPLPTLSGGEMQRIRLAGQIGRALTGVLYVLDEPTIGLHPRDNARLLAALQRLRDLGNTLILVEHDREVLQAADRLYDFGPGAGRLGGNITASGTPVEVEKESASLTGKYLSEERSIPIPLKRRVPPGIKSLASAKFCAENNRPKQMAVIDEEHLAHFPPHIRALLGDQVPQFVRKPKTNSPPSHTKGGAVPAGDISETWIPPGKGWLELLGARQHNLRDVDLRIPLGTFTCITGVSGSGKSSLIEETLAKAVAKELHRAQLNPGPYEQLLGMRLINKAIVVDQQPLGNTPASNPATYTGVFELIRELFARIPEAKVRGFRSARFSFNRPGGRCEACEGNGQRMIEMHFLPDVWVECDVCRGKRYNAETLAVQYRGRSIADVLQMSIGEACELFDNVPKIRRVLATLCAIGLDYLTLGQSAPTLSGGEAQRVKLAAELARPQTGQTLYILDEPTTGLHFDDIDKLLKVLNSLVDLGNSVVVIEHNLDVIKTADWVIDLGPEAGIHGGWIVTEGTPEEIVEYSQRALQTARTESNDAGVLFRSHTGEMLAPVLTSGRKAERASFDVTSVEKKRKGDLEISDVGRGTKMPWQVDGRRWHTVDRVSHEGKLCRWDGRALEYVINALESDDNFAPPVWDQRSVVEVNRNDSAETWFLHALTGDEWVLTLKFRVPRGTFREETLASELNLTSFDDLDDIPVYGRAARVRVKNSSGNFQEVTISVHSFADVDTPAFAEFLQKARTSVSNGKKSVERTHDLKDLEPWRVLGKTWHLKRTGIKGGKATWPVTVLEEIFNLLEAEVLIDGTVDWTQRESVEFFLPGRETPWARVETKRSYAVCLFLENGQEKFTRKNFKTMTTEPIIDQRIGMSDVLVFYMSSVQQTRDPELAKFIRRHAASVRENP